MGNPFATSWRGRALLSCCCMALATTPLTGSGLSPTRTTQAGFSPQMTEEPGSEEEPENLYAPILLPSSLLLVRIEKVGGTGCFAIELSYLGQCCFGNAGTIWKSR